MNLIAVTAAFPLFRPVFIWFRLVVSPLNEIQLHFPNYWLSIDGMIHCSRSLPTAFRYFRLSGNNHSGVGNSFGRFQVHSTLWRDENVVVIGSKWRTPIPPSDNTFKNVGNCNKIKRASNWHSDAARCGSHRESIIHKIKNTFSNWLNNARYII